MNACGGGNDDDDVGGVEVERNAVVALPLPSRCIDASAMPDIFDIDGRCQLMNDNDDQSINIADIVTSLLPISLSDNLSLVCCIAYY